MPFYRVHLHSGESDILYAHTEDHAKSLAMRKHGLGVPETENLKVEYLNIEDES